MNKSDKKINGKAAPKTNPPQVNDKAKNLSFDDGSKKKKVE